MDAFIELCVELLQPLGPVRPRRMFGGHGIYVDGLFMALVIGNQLYLKTDDVSRERFVAAGCEPFSYGTKNGERQVMSYYQPPEETLESPALMLPWARLALEAALRAANAKAAKPVAKKKSAAVAKRAAKPALSGSAASAKPAAKPAASRSAAKKPAAKKTTARRG
jgi:DNA transformation protein and related proteins